MLRDDEDDGSESVMEVDELMAMVGDEAGVPRRVDGVVVEDEGRLGMGDVSKEVKEVDVVAINDVVGDVVARTLLMLKERGDADESFGSGPVRTAEMVNGVMLLVEKMSDEGNGKESA